MRLVLCLLLMIGLAACGSSANVPTPSPGQNAPTVDANALSTRVSQTVVAGLTASAPTAKPATPVPPTNAPAPTQAARKLGKIGERVEGGGIALLVNGVTEGKGTAIYKPKGVLLVIDATLENVSLDKVDVNPLYFHVKDETGLQVEAALGGVTDQISLGDLIAGDKTRGKIAFDVPADGKGWVFFYDPLFPSLPDAPRVSLGR